MLWKKERAYFAEIVRLDISVVVDANVSEGRPGPAQCSAVDIFIALLFHAIADDSNCEEDNKIEAPCVRQRLDVLKDGKWPTNLDTRRCFSQFISREHNPSHQGLTL